MLPCWDNLAKFETWVNKFYSVEISELFSNIPIALVSSFTLEAIFLCTYQESMAFAASVDPDTMYLYHAMKEPDKQE